MEPVLLAWVEAVERWMCTDSVWKFKRPPNHIPQDQSRLGVKNWYCMGFAGRGGGLSQCHQELSLAVFHSSCLAKMRSLGAVLYVPSGLQWLFLSKHKVDWNTMGFVQCLQTWLFLHQQIFQIKLLHLQVPFFLFVFFLFPPSPPQVLWQSKSYFCQKYLLANRLVAQ